MGMRSVGRLGTPERVAGEWVRRVLRDTVPGSGDTSRSQTTRHLSPADDGAPVGAFAFSREWRIAAVAWWLVASAGAIAVSASVRSSIPFMVELVLAAGLFTIPGLAVSRLLVRRSHPAQRGTWWLWLYGLRSFFVYGYLAAAILLDQWVAGQPHGSPSLAITRTVAAAFGAVAVVTWGMVVHDTARNGVGGRDRSEIVLDVLMAAVVVGGAALAFGRSTNPSDVTWTTSFLHTLRPVDTAFGVAAGLFWSATLVQVLRETAGLRAASVDSLDLGAVILVLAVPPLVAVEPVLADHAGVLWLTLPLVFLAVALPGMICAALMIAVRMPGNMRQFALWALVLLGVSTGDAWAQLAMALSGYRLVRWPFIAAGCVNFGFFLVVPILERRRRFVGLGRLQPDGQFRRWDLVPAVVALGSVALLVQFFVLNAASGARVAIVTALGLLVGVGSARHYAGARETRRLHRQVVDMTEELYAQSRVDPLTGLGNRRVLQERFPQMAASCERTGRPLSIAMIDLDNFKRFNDTYGHLAGDQVLRDVADLVRAALRAEDLAARFGGEELCLALPGADPDQAAALLDRVRQARADVRRASPRPAGPALEDGVPAVHVTFSAGVARWLPGDGLDDVLRRADAACYAAKAGGRDRIIVAGAGDTAGGNGHRRPMV